MKTKFILLSVALVFVVSVATAQSDSVVAKQNKVQFKLGVNYNSNLNYFGRTDSLRSSGFFPLAEIWFTPNFYINAAPIFVNNAVQKFEYAGTVASAGYQFNANNKWLGNIYVVKPIYKETSELVQSALKAQTGVSLTKLSKVLNVTVGGDVKFSDKVDFGATGGLDHIIRCELPEAVLVFDPSAYVYAGTQQFSHTYYKNNPGIPLPGNNQQVTESFSQFNILAYELSLPIIFAKGKMQLSATPFYIIPQNLITVPNRPDLSERGKEMFYATLGAKISF